MSQRLTQALFALLLLCIGLAPNAYCAEAKKSVPAAIAQPAKKPQKTAEEYYLDGLACLQAEDTGCASVALAALNPASPYAKLLRTQLAAASGDFDLPLRLLIPLQAETGLLPQAYASLHATLALAYESKENLLNALEQRVKAEPFLNQPPAVTDNQSHIWKLLSTQAKEALIEMRGESPDPVVQGWIDLALAVNYADRKALNIEQWRSAYPDHPASTALLERIAETPAEAAAAETPTFKGKIALLLPLESPAYAAAAKAVQAGIMAAAAADGSQPEVAAYPTNGSGDGILLAYQRAMAEGAHFVIGPLTRAEVTALAAESLATPALALNLPDGTPKPQANLTLFGLSAEHEARQIARLAREQGMQSALVLAADTPLAQRMAKAFTEEWRAADGSIAAQLAIPGTDKLAELKAEASAHPADMIFLAANAAQARQARPWLDAATPTYGTSHLYDGVPKSIENADLLALHFVDAPWLVDPDNPDFAALPHENQESADLRRFFALGLDAYRLIPMLATHPVAGKELLDGASGHIFQSEGGVLLRKLPLAQFRRDGVALEPAP